MYKIMGVFLSKRKREKGPGYVTKKKKPINELNVSSTILTQKREKKTP
jgi:hypothetical protein